MPHAARRLQLDGNTPPLQEDPPSPRLPPTLMLWRDKPAWQAPSGDSTVADSRYRRKPAEETPAATGTPEILLGHSELFQRRLVDGAGWLEAQGALISGQRLLGHRADQAVHFSLI